MKKIILAMIVMILLVMGMVFATEGSTDPPTDTTPTPAPAAPAPSSPPPAAAPTASPPPQSASTEEDKILTPTEISKMNELYLKQKGGTTLSSVEADQLEYLSATYDYELATGKRKIETSKAKAEGTFTAQNMQRMNLLYEKQKNFLRIASEEEQELNSLMRLTNPTPEQSRRIQELEKSQQNPSGLTPTENQELEALSLEYSVAVAARTGYEPGFLARTGTFVSQFLATYDQYRGFARFGSLFFTSEAWEQHREKVNQAFCDTIILGGTQCWTSKICDTQLYPLLQRGTFSGRTPSGERQATASIQAEKSLPIYAVDKLGNPIIKHLYKVTYALTNPYEYQELKYNIEFRAEDGYKYRWYPDYEPVPADGAYRTEASPLINYGTHDYNTVCLVFHPHIVDYVSWHGRTIREWCTDIIPYQETATKPYPGSSNETTATPTPNAPTPLPDEDELEEHSGF